MSPWQQDEHVDIVEQNVHDSVWPPGQDYSRRLAARAGPDGSFTLQCTYADTEVLGWMNGQWQAACGSET